MKAWNQFIHYIQDAVMQIFSPATNDYPKTGEQPFTGDSNNENH